MQGGSAEPATFLVREMALTLDHLRRSRQTKTSLLKHLEEVVTSISNRLLNIRTPPHESSQSLWVDRDRIRNQLMNLKVKLEAQRQQVIHNHEKAMQQLNDRLLSLLNKHEQLDSSNDHGNTEHPAET